VAEDEQVKEVHPPHSRRDMMEIPFDADFPDIYADSLNISVGIYGVSIVLGRTKGNLAQPVSAPAAVVRMSPELAFVLAQLLRKNLKLFQEDIGPINVPDHVLEALGIEREL
jgi:hypothetical protein